MTSRRCRPPSAGGWSTSGCPRSGRSRSVRPTSSSPRRFGIPARGRTSSPRRSHELRGPRLGRRASTTTSSCPCPASTSRATRASATAPPPRSSPGSRPAFRRRRHHHAPATPRPLSDGASALLLGTEAAADHRRRPARPHRRARRGRPGAARIRLRPRRGRRAGAGPGRHRLGRRRGGRAQRGLRRAVPGLPRRLAGRPRASSTPRAARSRSGTRSAPPGARILGTLAHRLRESGDRWGVAAICIGVGQGARGRARERVSGGAA